jgi:PAS domain S-box-containing protein
VNDPVPASDSPLPPRPAEDEVAVLRAIVEGTAHGTGQEFFQSLVRHLAGAIDTRHAFVAELLDGTQVRTLAFWFRDRIIDNIAWDVIGTPCEDVVRGNLCHYPSGVKERFPLDASLVEWGIESYLGVPLRDAQGRHLGHLAVFDERPLPAEPRRLFIFRIFATRAAAELERLRAEEELAQSERRFRDLYEEAPTAYVSADAVGRLTRVNRRTAEMLGAAADEVLGTSLLDHAADTPAGKPRLRAAHQSACSGQSPEGVEIEMRRRDGRPLWVTAWFKPAGAPGGPVTGSRSIWADVTDRVLAEQEKAGLQQQNLYLQEEIKAAHNFEEIVGGSAALLAVLDNVSRVAPTDSTVLITGETGTGKELVARAIHSASKRKDRPLIKVNCAALPAGLVESELFGHEKGAFTGAIARRIGRFELAQGGTIFLDEIGELPPETQAKLLRVLQERELERVGGSSPIKVNVRVLAATNRDLLAAVRDRTFREDLYYRLNVFPVHLPPLRQRPEDVPLLVHFLVNRFAARIGRRIDSISRETLERLAAYPWPGNVRELENVLERAVILARGPILEIGADVLAVPPVPVADQSAPPAGTLEEMERRHIAAALRDSGGVIDGPRGAARVLGLHPNTLRSRMKKLGISRDPHDPS